MDSREGAWTITYVSGGNAKQVNGLDKEQKGEPQDGSPGNNSLEVLVLSVGGGGELEEPGKKE